MGSVAAKFRGANAPGMPAFVGLAPSWNADVWGAGHMGPAYEPVNGLDLPGRLAMPATVNVARLQDRVSLRNQFDQLQRTLDTGATMARIDQNNQMALDIVSGLGDEAVFLTDVSRRKHEEKYKSTAGAQPYQYYDNQDLLVVRKKTLVITFQMVRTVAGNTGNTNHIQIARTALPRVP